MKKKKLVFFLIFIPTLACNQFTNSNNIANTSAHSDSNELTNYHDLDSIPGIDCVRGSAEPIIKKTVFSNTSFVLLQDRLTGIETVIFDNNDKLIIKNWGCESYCLKFRFETTRFKEDTTNMKFWFEKAVLLMNEIITGINSPINIDKGTKELMNFITRDKTNDYVNLQLHEEIDFGGEEIRDYVVIDRIQKISENKYAIEISYISGPL